MATAEMTKDELLDRLYGVKVKILEIEKAFLRQAGIVNSFRQGEQELNRISTKGVVNKSKIGFVAAFAALILMNLFFSLLIGQISYVIEVIALGAIIFFLSTRKSKAAKVALVIAVLIAIFCIYNFVRVAVNDLKNGIFLPMILAVLMLALCLLLIIRLIPHRNAQIDRANEQIAARNAEVAAYNAQLQQQYNGVVAEIAALKGQLRDMTYGWYTTEPYFYSERGVSELIQLLETQRADTLKEALNKFDERQYQSQMLSYQDAILQAQQQQLIELKQLKSVMVFNSMLQMQNISLQSQTLNAVKQTNANVSSLGGKVDSLSRTVDSMSRR